ncbi:MAG: fluoride efflux transporter CrcB [Parabacteroides sp.]|nr:fluoride efflux transporter CrcB [Parabacteroides sp.]
MIKSLLIVGIGSFIGGALRYLISTLFKQFCTQGFPWGTLLVNLMGCFIFGAIFALFSKYSSTSHPWCLLLTTGLCGGFTTFSTFAYESVQMLQQGNLSGFIGYVATSLIAGISLFALGYWFFK